FAVMARTLGMPARVAVGFTPGEAVGPTTFRVYGRHAHAWPEVWFAGIGWVAFEPTPGRGSPDAADYLGVPAEQDDGPDAAPTTTTEPDATGSTTTTTVPGQTSSVPTTTVATGAGDPSSTTTPWAVLAGLALLAWGATAPTLVARRMARRHHARPARARVVRSWYRAVTMIERSGGPTSSGATAHEFATATGDESPEDADDITALAGIVDRVVFSLEPVDDETATRADGLAARLAARRRERLGTVQRVVLRCTPWTEWRLPRSRPARHGD
ncbi:MAG: transglutaminase domain-containing protein, partial [Ilumatobacteraceae bacterium]